MKGNVTGQVRLHAGEEEDLRRGRQWFYRSELAVVEGPAEPGDAVEVVDARGRFVARGFYNPASMLAVRVLSTRREEAIDAAFFRRRLEAAWAYRQRVLGDATDACRVVFGEADLLPGLVVDRFGDVLVLQCLSLGTDRWLPAIVEALVDLFAPRAIYERNDLTVRDLEGMPRRAGLLYGDLPAQVVISEGGVQFVVDVAGGQKTGHFLDQRLNRAALRPFCHESRVLDAFSYDGGFGLHAACYGAREVLALDISPAALALAAANAARNGVVERFHTREANAFDELRRLEKAGERFDVVILDPPAFAKSRQAVEAAYRGYKETNLRALKLLPPGGILATSSCSYHMGEELFLSAVHEAAFDARRHLRLIERRGAAPDHPVLLGHDESAYLKFFLFEAL